MVKEVFAPTIIFDFPDWEIVYSKHFSQEQRINLNMGNVTVSTTVSCGKKISKKNNYLSKVSRKPEVWIEGSPNFFTSEVSKKRCLKRSFQLQRKQQ